MPRVQSTLSFSSNLYHKISGVRRRYGESQTTKLKYANGWTYVVLGVQQLNSKVQGKEITYHFSTQINLKVLRLICFSKLVWLYTSISRIKQFTSHNNNMVYMKVLYNITYIKYLYSRYWYCIITISRLKRAVILASFIHIVSIPIYLLLRWAFAISFYLFGSLGKFPYQSYTETWQHFHNSYWHLSTSWMLISKVYWTVDHVFLSYSVYSFESFFSGSDIIGGLGLSGFWIGSDKSRFYV